jgi:hypothetical protein
MHMFNSFSIRTMSIRAKSIRAKSIRAKSIQAAFLLFCFIEVPICFADTEPYASDWQLRIDNDSMTSLVRDRNYTGGITFSQSGLRAATRFYSLDGWLGKLDSLFNFDSNTGTTLRHTMQFGLLVFTPESLSTKEPIFDDHPYSNLLFFANSRQLLSDDESNVTRSMLLLGLWGTNTAKVIQSGLHKLIDVEKANGWDNQISDGGEPTFRYSLSQTRFLKTNYKIDTTNYDLSTTIEGNIGFTTDVNAGISLRVGKIHSLGWLSLPEPSDSFTAAYSPLVSSENHRDSELFFLAGVNLRIRAYNVLFQGQFRDSKVTYSYSELNPLVGEIWLGAAAAFANGWQTSFIVRARTREFDARQATSHIWGGLTISRLF